MRKLLFLSVTVGLLLMDMTHAQADKKDEAGVFIDYGPLRYEIRAPKYDKDGNLVDSGDYPDAPRWVDPEMLPPDGLLVDYKPERIAFRQPIYDKEGNLLDSGDFPDAPIKVDPVRYELREPKYDKDGNLVDAGDYPNAPLTIDSEKLPESGEVLVNNDPSRIKLRQPIYDKDGNLVNYGDFPYASKHIDPDKLYPEEGVGDVSSGNDLGGTPPSSRIDATGSCYAYFPDKAGNMWTLNTYDKRGRLFSSTQNVIKSASNGSVTVQTFSYDKNGEPLGLKDKDSNIEIVEGEF